MKPAAGIVVAALIVAGCSAPTSEQDRPASGGAALPVRTADEELFDVGGHDGEGQLAWRYATDGIVSSSPTIADGVVYVGSRDGHVYAVTLADGALLWRYLTGAPVDTTPDVHDGTVYVSGTDSFVYALDAANGELEWRTQVGNAMQSSATRHGDTVYTGSGDGNLYALDADTGQERWRYATRMWVQSSPKVYDGVVYMGSDDGHLHAVDADTGQERWRFLNPARANVLSTPAHRDGIVYATAVTGGLYALDADTGELVWSTEDLERPITDPALTDELVLIAEARIPAVAAYGRINGEPVWRTQLGTDVASWRTSYQVASSPVVGGERVYVGSNDRHLYALDLDDGKVQWRYETYGWIMSSPAVSDEHVVVGSADGAIYAVNR